MLLFTLLIAAPLIEIGLFVTVGAWIGLWPTLAIVLGTGMLGFWILRNLGLQSMTQMRQSVSGMQDSTALMAHGAMNMLAAFLLILPGFMTDTMGLLLLIPVVQTLVLRWISARVRVVAAGSGGARGPRDPLSNRPFDPSQDVIDGEFIELDAAKRPTHSPSGWTRH